MVLPTINQSSTCRWWRIPLAPLAEMMFRSASVGPPTVQPSCVKEAELWAKMPSAPLPMATLAVMSVPMRLPMISPSSGPPPSTKIPYAPLPEMTL